MAPPGSSRGGDAAGGERQVADNVANEEPPPGNGRETGMQSGQPPSAMSGDGDGEKERVGMSTVEGNDNIYKGRDEPGEERLASKGDVASEVGGI